MKSSVLDILVVASSIMSAVEAVFCVAMFFFHKKTLYLIIFILSLPLMVMNGFQYGWLSVAGYAIIGLISGVFWVQSSARSRK